LDDALKVVIWGGRSQYNFIAKLRSDLMAAKGIQAGQAGPLALPAWTAFIHLVRNMLEAPKAAFQVPQLLRLSAADVLTSQPFLPSSTDRDLLLLNVRTAVADRFLNRQSDLVHAPSTVPQKSRRTSR
jgi:hypothetical protein